MSASRENKIENPSFIDLTKDGVLRDLMENGLEIFLFRNSIKEHNNQLRVERDQSVTVFINGIPCQNGMEFGIDLRFEVPLDDAQRIVAIRDSLRKEEKH